MNSGSHALPNRPLGPHAESAPHRSSGQARQADTRIATRVLADSPRWLFLACLVFAPWAYGATRPWAETTLGLGLIAVQALWWTGCAVRRSAPRLSWGLVVPVVWLLIQGWWMAANGHGEYHLSLGVLLPVEPWLGWAPGSVEGSFSRQTMLILTALLGSVLFTADLAHRPVWRNRLGFTLLITGVSLAFFGLILKLGGSPALAWVWEPEKIDVANNFAMFRYRGNAGAFMNLILPLLIIRAWLSFRHAEPPRKKAFWVCALFVLAAAIQFNPSRASWCLALVLAAATVLVVPWILRRLGLESGGWSRGTIATAGVAGLLATVSLGAILVLGGWETSWKRILRFGLDGGHRSPVMVYRAMVPDAGWLGFGPGTFETIFPAYQTTHPYNNVEEEALWTRGYWRHAHQDYYQTLIEWGYAGTLAWSVIFLGGLIAAWRRILRDPQDPSSMRWVRCASILALGGVLLHACGDFPLQIASIQLYTATLLGFCWTR